MWQKKESKPEPAAAMVRHVMPEFHAQKNVIIVCDSRYVKQNPVSVVDEYDNLDRPATRGLIPSCMTCHRPRPGKRQACKTWPPPVNRYRFYPFQ